MVRMQQENKMANENFDNFARGLIANKESVDPDTLRRARDWYLEFVGSHAVTMADRDLVEIYQDLH